MDLSPQEKREDYQELLEKYKALLFENDRLKKEIENLKSFSGINRNLLSDNENPHISSEPEIIEQNAQQLGIINSSITNNSPSAEKIQLFLSLFKGRDDVFARRWENQKKETSGYSPACTNEWRSGICQKPKVSCTDCKHKEYNPLNEKVVEAHLRGQNNLVVGIYPLLLNETCHFLAIDFDDEGWQKDVTTLRGVCNSFDIPITVERSRSGNGAHVWFFFELPISASLARKFGSALLTFAMSKQHDIPFKSYDRLFPNQDTMPKGGFGNLIALPLQKAARGNGNSVFVDESFHPYDDQWAFLSSIQRLSEKRVEYLISKLCDGNELGMLKKDVEQEQKPWETVKIELRKEDFPPQMTITKANMLFVSKEGCSQRALNQMKRLAAFKNPEFYKAQAMRLSTFNKPRIISCSEETNDFLCLPRGCELELIELLNQFKIKLEWDDKTNQGKHIDVQFNGELRGEQPLAVSKMLEYSNGVLCGTTAFGKTVAAIKLIAERKVNTLILVNRISLVAQWKDKISEFLTINETLPVEQKTSKKKNQCIVGQYGGGKKELTGIIDIAVMQSLSRDSEVDECVKGYGMVIVDECHHVSAFSFELILKNIPSKFVYGLTATPTRKDGHHPIITMQCGPIRFRDDAKKQAEKRPFDHYIIPRFTSSRIPTFDEKESTITDLYAGIVVDETRNQQIIADVSQCYKEGRNCIILTERTAHVELLANELRKQIPEVIAITGGRSAKETRELLALITNAPTNKPIILVATGRYIGEGFDEPRLDTLFLAMPISWKGTLQQYAGRLHRLYEGKKEVIVYDYVDVHVRMLEKMYHRRLSGYASIGYKIKGDIISEDAGNIIFDKDNFQTVYSCDILNASNEITIVSPFITKKRTIQMSADLQLAIQNGVTVTIVTRPEEEYKPKDIGSWNDTVAILKNKGATLLFKPNIHQKFAIIDQKIVWYGSINLLSFGIAEESMMRLVSGNVAYELGRIVEANE
jgi:superfamily II DNA or RNA helicase